MSALAVERHPLEQQIAILRAEVAALRREVQETRTRAERNARDLAALQDIRKIVEQQDAEIAALRHELRAVKKWQAEHRATVRARVAKHRVTLQRGLVTLPRKHARNNANAVRLDTHSGTKVSKSKSLTRASDVRRNSPKPERVVTQGQAGFDRFWTLYPKRVGKMAARRVWTRLKCEAIATQILAAVERQMPYLTREHGEFIPNPATWLNQGRWEDEPPRTFSPSQAHTVRNIEGAALWAAKQHTHGEETR